MDDSQFEAAVRSGTFPPAEFSHRMHLRFAYSLLRREPFLDACIVMREALKDFAARAGKPGLYHETVTVALMSLIAERMPPDDGMAFDDWLAAHPELSDRGLLYRYYRPEVLNSPRAREHLVLDRRT